MSSQKGVTLIELMIGIGMLAILVAIAVPNYQLLVKNNRLTSASNELLGVFQVARAEAVRSNRRVVLMLEPAPVATNNEGHVMVFVDADRDSVQDAGERQVRTFLLPAGTLTLTAVNGSGTAVDRISFQPDGRTLDSATMSVSVCDDRGKGKALSLLGSGQARLTGDITCS
ncbi:GspH/FimT family pseudopilin [Saccharospirillum sp.]|uniref:GspH/FimT family pseudopilin n=1 Tax=Saccharospirillum sp. TaxID=2033801 RepID=UPI0034A05ED6